MNQPYVLEADSVGVEIDGTVLLAPTSVSVEPGSVWAVTGENGSGKTTLLRTFIGAMSPTSGRALTLGRTPSRADPLQRRSVASLVDSIPIARDMTVEEQVALVAVSWFGRSDETSAAVTTMLDSFGIEHLRRRFPHQLSSGQLQLFNLALTFVRPARVVILDEPERHLDDHRLTLVSRLVGERASQGTAVVMATHHASLKAQCESTLCLS